MNSPSSIQFSSVSCALKKLLLVIGRRKTNFLEIFQDQKSLLWAITRNSKGQNFLSWYILIFPVLRWEILTCRFIVNFKNPERKHFSRDSIYSTASFHQKNYCLMVVSSLVPKFFTAIWYPFCRRLLRSADVTFLKTGWWNSNVQTSWSH